MQRLYYVPCVLFLLLAACSRLPAGAAGQEQLSAPIDLAQVFPAEAGGWQPEAEARLYDHQTIFQLVDGQAEAFFAYNFEQAAIRRYQSAAGTRLMAEIWQVAAPADAFGLFTANRTGAALAAGNGGSLDPAGRLCFWQDRYFVNLHADGAIAPAELQAFSAELAARLPSGGEPPALLQRLPASAQASGDFIFFRQEISIQSLLWLGGENVLGLDASTAGWLAKVESGGQPGSLLLVEYPTAAGATAALQALQARQMPELRAADSQEKLLGAVFGALDAATARQLLAEALQPAQK